MKDGWKCPKCDRCWAPTVRGCDACNGVQPRFDFNTFRFDHPIAAPLQPGYAPPMQLPQTPIPPDVTTMKAPLR